MRGGRFVPHRAQRVTQVLHQVFEERERTRISMDLLRSLKSAKSDHRLPPRFPRLHAPSDMFLDGESKVRLHLCVQVAITSRFLKKRTQSVEKLTHSVLPRGVIASTRAITSNSLRQYAMSSASCVRPLTVVE